MRTQAPEPSAPSCPPVLCRLMAVGFLRIFLRAANDRLEGLMVAPGARPLLHARALALLLGILGVDCAAGSALAAALPALGRDLVLLMAFDVAVVALDGAHALLK